MFDFPDEGSGASEDARLGDLNFKGDVDGKVTAPKRRALNRSDVPLFLVSIPKASVSGRALGEQLNPFAGDARRLSARRRQPSDRDTLGADPRDNVLEPDGLSSMRNQL